MFFSKLFQELPLVALTKQEKIHFVSRGFSFQSGLKSFKFQVSGFKFQVSSFRLQVSGCKNFSYFFNLCSKKLSIQVPKTDKFQLNFNKKKKGVILQMLKLLIFTIQNLRALVPQNLSTL
jgi:hypothetical protein